jgi:hypothetical protein
MFVYPARYQGLWIVTLYNTSGFVAVFVFPFTIRFTGRGQWLVARLGGTLSFDADSSGTVATVRLPRGDGKRGPQSTPHPT